MKTLREMFADLINLSMLSFAIYMVAFEDRSWYWFFVPYIFWINVESNCCCKECK